MKKDFNLFKLQGIPVSDEKVLDIYGKSQELANTPQLSIEIIEDARNEELREYPEEAELINMKYDRQIRSFKLRLASRGMLPTT